MLAFHVTESFSMISEASLGLGLTIMREIFAETVNEVIAVNYFLRKLHHTGLAKS